MGFYDTYSLTFEHFHLALDALSNSRLTHQKFYLIKLEISLRPILYDLKKTSPNYQLVFQHMYSYYPEALVSIDKSSGKLPLQIPIL